ncbi:MAG: hypothetical protein HY852_26745 [Bradyrhizobium sp.]|uniref:hypothetical protein n=1 Tax=Bradyrhizobium sp. TaxID=376 RepID=UPI0025C1391D|nr:hypothetical protein [Bradyrhizobium sp.]MBI5265408.1 hypothetical protein [Bradyrhizobium sp.]
MKRLTLSAFLTMAAVALQGGTCLAREIENAEADAFTARMFAGAPGKNASACFVRHYDADRLADRPHVAAIKLLIKAEHEAKDNTPYHSFRLGVEYRHRSGEFGSRGDCGHTLAADKSDEVRFVCNLGGCEGDGLEIALSKDGKSVTVRVEGISIWHMSHEEAQLALGAGPTGSTFRLNRTDARRCASLAANRKERATTRRN